MVNYNNNNGKVAVFMVAGVDPSVTQKQKAEVGKIHKTHAASKENPGMHDDFYHAKGIPEAVMRTRLETAGIRYKSLSKKNVKREARKTSLVTMLQVNVAKVSNEDKVKIINMFNSLTGQNIKPDNVQVVKSKNYNMVTMYIQVTTAARAEEIANYQKPLVDAVPMQLSCGTKAYVTALQCSPKPFVYDPKKHPKQRSIASPPIASSPSASSIDSPHTPSLSGYSDDLSFGSLSTQYSIEQHYEGYYYPQAEPWSPTSDACIVPVLYRHNPYSFTSSFCAF